MHRTMLSIEAGSHWLLMTLATSSLMLPKHSPEKQPEDATKAVSR